MYVYTYIYIHIYIYICIILCVYICVYVCICIYADVYYMYDNYMYAWEYLGEGSELVYLCYPPFVG
jgi:hypothetical protein